MIRRVAGPKTRPLIRCGMRLYAICPPPPVISTRFTTAPFPLGLVKSMVVGVLKVDWGMGEGRGQTSDRSELDAPTTRGQRPLANSSHVSVKEGSR